MFPFAYADEEFPFGHGQSGDCRLPPKYTGELSSDAFGWRGARILSVTHHHDELAPYIYCANSTNATTPRRGADDLDKLNQMVLDAIARGDASELKRLYELLKLINDIYEVMDKTKIFEFWPGGCQRWIDKFEAHLQGFKNPLIKERSVGWEPSGAIGGGHAYYYFLLHDGTLIIVDHWIYYGGSRLRIYLPPN